jgi:hypothetical protein
MSTSNTGYTSIAQPSTYPTFKELRTGHVPVCKSSNGADRIFWNLDGPLTSAISVMKDSHSPESLEPYFQQTVNGGIWHPVSQLPVSEPSVSSITVCVYKLEMWEYDWMQNHREHSDSDIRVCYRAERVRYGALDNRKSDSDLDKSEHLLECCGLPRPQNKDSKIIVRPTESGEGFITIHDYLSTVHPWLISLREDILSARNVWETNPGTDLMVDCNGLDSLMIYEKAEWIKDQSYRFDPVSMDAARIRKWPELGPANKDL